MDIRRFAAFRERVMDSCSRVIVGKDREIFDVMVCLICSGHVLLEDIPGTGKTRYSQNSPTTGTDVQRMSDAYRRAAADMKNTASSQKV